MDYETRSGEDYDDDDDLRDPSFKPHQLQSHEGDSDEVDDGARSQSKSRVTKKTKSDGKLRKNYNKRVERKWEKEDTLKLIQEVEARPLLWDVGAAELKLPKEHLWEEVAAALNANLNDCKGNRGNLRTSFNVKLAAYQEIIGSRHRRNDFSFLAILQADDVLESQ